MATIQQGRRLRNTGAWQPGDEPGGRRFAEVFTAAEPMPLISGERLGPVTMAYECWGERRDDNCVLVLPPLSMTSHASGPDGPGHPRPGWWAGLVGPGLAVDTDRFFVVCPNNLGGCDGSTGPASAGPDGRPWAARFPGIDVVDQVTAEAALADALGIERWHTVIGMSIGGARALEWAISRPQRVERHVLIAVSAATRIEQAGLTNLELLQIRNDPHFHGGDYYEREEGCGPEFGVAMARSIAHVRYGAEQGWQDRFGGDTFTGDSDSCHRAFAEHLVEQGRIMYQRFDANCYLTLSEAALKATVARGRTDIESALASIRCPAVVIGFSSDRAYPPATQQDLADGIAGAQLRLVDSPLGHYTFLFGQELLAGVLSATMRELS